MTGTASIESIQNQFNMNKKRIVFWKQNEHTDNTCILYSLLTSKLKIKEDQEESSFFNYWFEITVAWGHVLYSVSLGTFMGFVAVCYWEMTQSLFCKFHIIVTNAKSVYLGES